MPITKVFVRSAYNYDMMSASDESGLFCLDESLTKQSFAAETDINTIVRNFGLTGELPDDIRAPQSGDFTGIKDFHGALNAVAEAREAFMELPAPVRYRFANDPQRLLEFCDDPSNYAEAVKLGLAMPRPSPAQPAISPKGAEGEQGGKGASSPPSTV